ncbi:MAG: ATP-binding cassette domain-containing protein, partial [Deltaproteobacteria bacterium]|nr:ATP-binding cassette domain-containing protein [Deltaproteobacteria bacterium]
MIEAKHLRKHFGKTLAVDDISFKVERGEVLGFLGPNAAGKSTTMRMLTGFLTPTSGTAVVGGEDIVRSSLAARKKLGYLPENAPVY